jgi:parallel beta-helix repeat protein
MVAHNTISGITGGAIQGGGWLSTGDGVRLRSLNNSVITDNMITSNECGIFSEQSCNITVSDNVITSNYFGIELDQSYNITVSANVVINNWEGIFMTYSDSNIIYNNFFDNKVSIGSNKNPNAFDAVGHNIWNITKTGGTNIVGGPYLGGNYWADYKGQDLDGDLLGNTLVPYNCSGDILRGGDYHPLIWSRIHNLNTSEAFTTIQAAINAPNTQNGHIIEVDPGTYIENVKVNKSVTIRSTSGNPADTIVQAAVGDHVFNATADYVNISGLTVTGGSYAAGIYLLSAHRCSITNTNLSNNYYGIYLYSSSNNTVTGNTANSNNYNGIYLYSSSNNTVTGNTANSNNYNGIYLYVSCKNNNLTGNSAINNSGRGIMLTYNSESNILSANSVSSNGYGIFLDSSSNCNNITGNYIYNNSNHGIGIPSCSNNIITANYVYNNSGNGIYLSLSNNNTITGNFVYNNSPVAYNFGISLGYSNNNTIYNNYFENTYNANDWGYNIWNITKTVGTNILGGPYLGGNYWSDYTGNDTDSDWLGNTLLPYNCKLTWYPAGSIQHGGDWLPLVKGWLPYIIEPYTALDVGVTSNITMATSGDIIAYLPPGYDGLNISDAVVLNVNVTDDTPGNPADDAYSDITVNIGKLDVETCKVFKAGMGFLSEVPDVTTLPTVGGEPAFSRNLVNNTVTIRLYVGDPLIGVIPALASLPLVRGTLTYACNGTGIAGVAVNLTQQGGLLASTTTDTSGQYSFANVSSGAYVVNVSKWRCFENSSTVTVYAGETAVVNLTLWLKGDLNNNCIQADAGDLAKLKDASVGKIGADWRYDLNSNTIYADAGDLAKLKDASVGKIELV